MNTDLDHRLTGDAPTGTTRSVHINYRSHISDEAWPFMLAEIEEAVEQIACDYAAAMRNDSYEVSIEASTQKS